MQQKACEPQYPLKSDSAKSDLHHLSKSLDLYFGHYDNLFVLRDLNCKTSEKDLGNFCKLYNLFDIVRKPSCFKNPSCVDFFKKRNCYTKHKTQLDYPNYID